MFRVHTAGCCFQQYLSRLYRILLFNIETHYVKDLSHPKDHSIIKLWQGTFRASCVMYIPGAVVSRKPYTGMKDHIHGGIKYLLHSKMILCYRFVATLTAT